MIVPDMGINSTERISASGLAGALFTPVQQRVLGLLFGQPERKFQSADLIRLASSGTGATHRLAKRLAASGLVRMSRDGRQIYYQANSQSPVFGELVGLVQKTVGLVGPLRQALQAMAIHIHAAFVFGSVAAGRDRGDSDIDLMVVAGDALSYADLYAAVQTAESELGRTVNPTIVTPAQWWEKRARADGFLARVAGRPRLPIIGDEGDIPVP